MYFNFVTLTIDKNIKGYADADYSQIIVVPFKTEDEANNYLEEYFIEEINAGNAILEKRNARYDDVDNDFIKDFTYFKTVLRQVGIYISIQAHSLDFEVSSIQSISAPRGSMRPIK